MKKQIAILGCFLLLLNACGKSDESTAQTEEDLIGFEIEETVGPSVSKDLLQVVARDSKDFRGEFKKFDAAQKYYFCAATKISKKIPALTFDSAGEERFI